MNNAASKALNIFQKAKSESMSDKDFATFNRVEKRLSAIAKSRISSKLGAWRAESSTMSPLDILKEKHSSKRLGDFLRAAGIARPAAKWEAHHIVSGNHVAANQARAILADEDSEFGLMILIIVAGCPKQKQTPAPQFIPMLLGTIEFIGTCIITGSKIQS